MERATVCVRSNVDSDARRLECRVVQRNGQNQPLGCTVLCGTDDLRQLCIIQFARRHSGRRVQFRGKSQKWQHWKWRIKFHPFPQRNERREREQRELVKKLREENENLSDLMFDECRSCSESTSTNGSYQEIRTKWHSAEDVRNRKVSVENPFHLRMNCINLAIQISDASECQEERET